MIATFCFFLLWYAFFIVAFGLGFYILLHKKPEDKPEDGIENTNENDKTSDVKVVCAKEDGYAFFNSPWLSLIKTSTMFVGELVIMMYLITSFESFERLSYTSPDMNQYNLSISGIFRHSSGFRKPSSTFCLHVFSLLRVYNCGGFNESTEWFGCKRYRDHSG